MTSGQEIAITAAIIVAIALLVLFVYKESTGFRVVHYSFVNNKLRTDSFRFAMISDLHDCVYGEDNIPVLEAIDKERVDAVFLAGDMVTSYMEPKYHDENAVGFVKKTG